MKEAVQDHLALALAAIVELKQEIADVSKVGEELKKEVESSRTTAIELKRDVDASKLAMNELKREVQSLKAAGMPAAGQAVATSSTVPVPAAPIPPVQPTNWPSFGSFLVKVPLPADKTSWTLPLNEPYTMSSAIFACGPATFSLHAKLGQIDNPTSIGVYIHLIDSCTRSPKTVQVHYQIQFLDRDGSPLETQKCRALLCRSSGYGWPRFKNFIPESDVIRDGDAAPYLHFRVKLYVRRTFESDMDTKGLNEEQVWKDSPIR